MGGVGAAASFRRRWRNTVKYDDEIERNLASDLSLGAAGQPAKSRYAPKDNRNRVGRQNIAGHRPQARRSAADKRLALRFGRNHPRHAIERIPRVCEWAEPAQSAKFQPPANPGVSAAAISSPAHESAGCAHELAKLR